MELQLFYIPPHTGMLPFTFYSVLITHRSGNKYNNLLHWIALYFFLEHFHINYPVRLEQGLLSTFLLELEALGGEVTFFKAHS